MILNIITTSDDDKNILQDAIDKSCGKYICFFSTESILYNEEVLEYVVEELKSIDSNIFIPNNEIIRILI